MTPTIPVPEDWYAPLRKKTVLCMTGGGNHGPLLTAMGIDITVYDPSPGKLHRDTSVSIREGLPLKAVQGEFQDLSRFADNQFDLIFFPMAKRTISSLRHIWAECFRVLCPGGDLLLGYLNPEVYGDDMDSADFLSLSDEELDECQKARRSLPLGHNLDDILLGLARAGFSPEGSYAQLDDTLPGSAGEFPVYMAEHCKKPQYDERGAIGWISTP